MKYVLLLLFIGGLEAGLRDKAKKIYIGTAVTISEINDRTEHSLVGKEFNMLTPGNEMKWDATERIRGVKNYTNADSIVKFAFANTMRVRGHNLIWHQQLPSWINGLNKEELQKAVESRINGIVGHYKGKLYAWDVVNEPFEDNGNFRQNVFFQRLGESYIAQAFRLARAADPSVKLYINDYNIESINGKSNAMYNLVKKLKAEGVPIDGVGFQGHYIIGQVSRDLQANLQRFADLGVEVAITELDIRIWLPPNEWAPATQASEYANIIKACEAVSKCVGVTIWGMSDKYSWVPSTFPGWGEALLWDKDFKIKQAYTAVENAL